MEEVYSFAARVAERGMRQILVIPEDPQALLEYFERAQLPSKLYLRGDVICVSVGRKLWLSKATELKECSIRSRRKNTRSGRQMWGVAHAPLP